MNDYYQRVYDIISQIPEGRVTTYGEIASYLGLKGGARLVGWACNAGTSDSKSMLPFHRVINKQGLLSGRHHFIGDSMKERLVDEGVHVSDDYAVDIEKYFWSPYELD